MTTCGHAYFPSCFFQGCVVGPDATETGNDISQPKFWLSSMPITQKGSSIEKGHWEWEKQKQNPKSDARHRI